MLKNTIQVCSRCIMDTTDPDITFDEQGVCCHCRAYDRRAAAELTASEHRKRKWEEIVATIKAQGKGKEYDCVIGVSGGVDSTMVAYLAKDAGLRPIAVHFDNGWNSELAVSNIKQTLDILNIDMLTFVVDWEEFRDLQVAFLKASVPNCEIPTDHGICALLWNTANRLGIKYILSGSNLATECIMPESWAYTAYDLRHLTYIHRKFSTRRLKTFPRLNAAKLASYVFLKGIRQVNPLNYIDYHKEHAVEFLKNKLGWRQYGGKHYESVYTRFFQGEFLIKKFGYDKRLPHLSSLIVSGQISREAALEQLKEDGYPDSLRKEDRVFVLKKLGLSEEDYAAILATPPKRHDSYPLSLFLSPRFRHFVGVFKRMAMRVSR